MITCGDNYHGNGIASADSPRWKTEFEDIYNHPSLQIPWYPSLGNHDNRGKVDAEIAYSKLSSRWKLPARYYTHREKIAGTTEALFVHLDTSPFVAAYHKKGSSYNVEGQDPKAQLRWLESVLANSTGALEDRSRASSHLFRRSRPRRHQGTGCRRSARAAEARRAHLLLRP